MIKFHQKYFIESIPFEEVNPDQIRNNNNKFRNLHNIENKLTRFQIYPETELACKYKKPGHLIENPMATSHSLTDENPYLSVNFLKNLGQIGGRLKPQDTDSTRLQELSLMNRKHFGTIHYDIRLDMKLDYTISRIFQGMSLSELETLHQLCELERTQILQSPYGHFSFTYRRKPLCFSKISEKHRKNRWKIETQDADSTRLQELSLVNRKHFGTIHYNIRLDMKLDYTISRIFQGMSLSELETLHQLCELERTQILQSPYGHFSFTYRRKPLCFSKISEKHRKNRWKIETQDADSTRLQELSLVNRKHFGTIPMIYV